MPAMPIAPPSWLRVELTPLMSAAKRASTAVHHVPDQGRELQAETEAATASRPES